MNKKKVELLAPAGDLEKLKVAVLYGADAVFLAGNLFGLRAKAKNFSFEDMKEGVNFAHSHNAKVYVTCNIFARNVDFTRLENYLLQLREANVDGLIIADPGIFYVARRVVPELEIHISTQANITNYEASKFWLESGATRVVLARELSFTEIKTIKENIPADAEIEAFIHGAMCMAYSGRCLLSNYFINRDANKGACAQACRWKYYIVEETRPNEYYPIEEDDNGTYIFNAKDLCMIRHIPELIDAGIYSFKIEGRSKTAYYAGAVVKAYREAIDDYLKDPELYESKKDYYFEQVQKTSNRGYCTGFYYKRTTEQDQVYTTNSYCRTYDFIGIVKSYDKETSLATIEQRNKFVLGDKVEFITPKGSNFEQVISEMYDENDVPVQQAPHPQQILKIKMDREVLPFTMMRKEADNPVTF